MQENPYLILNIRENATDDEIESAYFKLRRKYSEDRFLPGEEGRLAAEKLSELDQAYEDIKRLKIEKTSFQNYGSAFGEVERLIKAGELEKAQQMLDNMSERGAEWHYLQSIIFYRKNWFTESLKQLQFAISIDPQNTKYSDAHIRLKNLMYGPQNNQTVSGGQYNGQYQQNRQVPPQQQQQMGCCSGSGAEESCCCQLLCFSCCCELMSSGGC